MDNKKEGMGIFIVAILAISVFAAMPVIVTAQDSTTLFVISDNYSPDPILEAYGVDASGIGLTLLTTYNLTQGCSGNNGPVGTALDDENDKLFVSYEFCGDIIVFDARNFNFITSITTPGRDIAGMIVDTETNTLYAADRGASTIYMYDTETYASKGTGTITVGAWGLAFDSTNNHLYVTDTSNIVSVYDASTFALVTTYDTGNPAVGIAVDFRDPTNVSTYTTSLWAGATYKLTKYNTATGATTVVSTLGMPTGVTVDPDTDNVYTTNGAYGALPIPRIEVYDTPTMTLQNTVDLSAGWTPTDLFIGKVRFEPAAPVPTLTPIGLIALFGLLSAVAAITIRKRL